MTILFHGLHEDHNCQKLFGLCSVCSSPCRDLTRYGSSERVTS